MFDWQQENSRYEVTQYQTGRCISTNEPFQRRFGFPLHERHSAIVQIAVHLEKGQFFYFIERNAIQLAQKNNVITLTAFLKMC